MAKTAGIEDLEILDTNVLLKCEKVYELLSRFQTHAKDDEIITIRFFCKQQQQQQRKQDDDSTETISRNETVDTDLQVHKSILLISSEPLRALVSASSVEPQSKVIRLCNEDALYYKGIINIFMVSH